MGGGMKPHLLAGLALIFLLLGCAQQGQAHYGNARITFLPSNYSINAEVADTPAALEKGLMFRTSLAEDAGMLFDFNETAYHAFWMLNTKIPLEAIFLDENFTIVDMVEMAPCNDTGSAERMPNCTVYLPRLPGRYALEVNQNFSERHGIEPGQKIEVVRQQ
jgi:uncharacterized protein